ncbi:hypothetical protein [Paenibacillus sp. J22TS3]|uniref:hypothetical protein n=1 Tax=Paenibacillus sp. J22TS3 TaxID=2807192 RepID=UPI001B085005|nr:hypothetical protein [Paenibacillus sp. J22TS3]GIP21961.1 hypothetical protein J22TS3_22360 [Paenibacillus sp. J22TS3]
MKESNLIAPIALTAMLFSSSGAVFAAESSQKTSIVSDSVQNSDGKKPVYGTRQ